MALSKMMYVYDVTTKTNVAVCLPRDGMETVGWLICAVEKELTSQLSSSGGPGTQEECIDLSNGSILVGLKRKLGRNAWEKSVASYLLLGGAWIVRSRRTTRFVGRRNGQIFATMNGKTITLNVTAQDTILQIKQKIEEKEGVPLSVQSLQARGKVLRDSCTLEFHEIPMESTVFVMVRGPGGAKATFDNIGGVEFADVTKVQSGFKVRNWSTSAPNYRRAAPGLCLEGICTHKPCQARKKRVIVNIGFQEGFDICRDCYKSKCPLCDEYVQPITVAFNNCKWMWVGEKVVSPKQPAEVIQSEWYDADNNYHIFDEKETGTVRWLNLTFMTVDRSQHVGVPECGICLEPLCTNNNANDPVQTLVCGHELHRSCIRKLKRFGSTCPFCSAQISPYQKKRSGGIIGGAVLSRTLCIASV